MTSAYDKFVKAPNDREAEVALWLLPNISKLLDGIQVTPENEAVLGNLVKNLHGQAKLAPVIEDQLKDPATRQKLIEMSQNNVPGLAAIGNDIFVHPMQLAENIKDPSHLTASSKSHNPDAGGTPDADGEKNKAKATPKATLAGANKGGDTEDDGDKSDPLASFGASGGIFGMLLEVVQEIGKFIHSDGFAKFKDMLKDLHIPGAELITDVFTKVSDFIGDQFDAMMPDVKKLFAVDDKATATTSTAATTKTDMAAPDPANPAPTGTESAKAKRPNYKGILNWQPHAESPPAVATAALPSSTATTPESSVVAIPYSSGKPAPQTTVQAKNAPPAMPKMTAAAP